MKLLQLTLLFTTLSFTISNPFRACEDREGKFRIPELGGKFGGKLKSCKFVQNNIHLCIDSWKARSECIKTCGGCQEDTAICLDARGKFDIPELDNESRNCQYVRNENIELCNLSWTVRDRCQKTCGKCVDVPEELLDEDDTCLDDRGPFEIPQLNGEERNCQYVRNQNMKLCTRSWKVRNKCPRTCGECGPNAGKIEKVCTDKRKKFIIKELDGEVRNCQHVRRHRMELCEISSRVKRRCKKTCGICE